MSTTETAALEPVQITGGRSSVRARTDDLRSHARLLDSAAGHSAQLAAQIALVMADLPPLSWLLAPAAAVRAAGAAAEATVGRHGLVPIAGRLELLSTSIVVCAQAYDQVEQVQRSWWAAVPVPLTVTALAAQAGTTAVLTGARFVSADPGRGLELAQGRSQTWAVLAERIRRDQFATIYAHPWIMHAATAPVATTALDLLTTATAIVQDPPGTLPGADDAPLVVRRARRWRTRTPLTGTRRGPLARDDLGALLETETAIFGGASGARIRAERVTGPAGSRWVLYLPGTQNWGQGQANPSDAYANAALISGRSSRLQRAVPEALADAMHQAGVRPGAEEVMLVGHSQGGMLAMRLAEDPAVRRRFRVRSVVTAGSPTALMTPHPSVQVLALEHTTDPVPYLDGAHNPDRANRLNVRVAPSLPVGTLAPSAGSGDSATPGRAHLDDITHTHGPDRYALSAREQLDRSTTDPLLSQWYREHDPYLTGTRTTYDYEIHRVQPGEHAEPPKPGAERFAVAPRPVAPSPITATQAGAAPTTPWARWSP